MTEASRRLTAGLVQMRSGADPARNCEAAEALIREAAGRGATFIATPETTTLVQKDADKLFAVIQPQESEPAVRFFADLAGSLGVHLLIGSIAIRLGPRRAANRSFLFGPDGKTIATYDKIHMFDVGLGKGETYSESTNYQAGERGVIAEAAGARIGLTICYDLRFAYLYRALAQAGAEVITAPSAFTRPTGRAHWSTLIRARAIETGSYILAPAQGGLHEDGRRTWGRTMIAGPWGETAGVLDHDAPGVLIAELDLGKVAEARRRIPALTHDRPVKFE